LQGNPTSAQLAQGVQKSFCRVEVGGVESFGKGVVNRPENCLRVGGTGQLITGQNPASSGPTAELLIDTLTKEAR